MTTEENNLLQLLVEERYFVVLMAYDYHTMKKGSTPKLLCTSAKIDRILALKPDFVIGFSDLQADIAQALIRHGIEVWISNHRSIEGILGYIRRLGALIGSPEKADRYIERLEQRLGQVRAQAERLTRRPRVYFEEWDEPMISGIAWVSELIELAGGSEIFPERARSALASGRIIAAGEEVIAAPSRDHLWLLVRQALPARAGCRPPGLAGDSGGARRQPHEIKSPIILQPGPAALTDGLEQLQRVILAWAAGTGS